MWYTDLFLFALGDEHYDASLTLAAGASHALHEADWTLVCIEADDEVNVADVQTFFTDAR